MNWEVIAVFLLILFVCKCTAELILWLVDGARIIYQEIRRAWRGRGGHF